jgi:CheY-like chemotaxis protein
VTRRGGWDMASGAEKLRVLVVDDDPVIADSLGVILNANGYHAKSVHSAEEALEDSVLLAPDVLITDVVMTGMSGIDLAIYISNTVPTCKIILFSGQAQTANLLAEAEELGYRFELLQKPVHPEVLLQRLSEYVTSLKELGGMEMREG